MVATTWEKRPAGFLAVPLNIRCSRKWASPDLPGVSSAEPTLYQSMWVTTGVRWSGMTTTSRPFESVKLVIWGPIPAWAGAASAAARTAVASVSLLGTNLLSWVSPPRCTFRRRNARANLNRCSLNVDGARCRGCSRSLPALELLVRRNDLALVLHADPVRVVGRGGLIAGGRRGHGLALRLAGERGRFRLRRSKRRPYGTEYLFGLGAEIGGHQRTGRVLRGFAGALGVRALLLAEAGLVEFVGPQRPHLLFHRQVPLEFRFLGRQLLLAPGDIGVLRPSRGFRHVGFVARRRQIAAGRHHQRRALAEVDLRPALAPEPEIFHELAKELGIERNVFFVVLRAGAPRAPRQRQSERNGRGGGRAPQPLRISAPHSYPLQMTAECAVSPQAIVARIRALLRHPGR